MRFPPLFVLAKRTNKSIAGCAALKLALREVFDEVE